MSIMRIKNMVPEVYSNTSRDFQLLTRLYDLVINGVKFDIDAINQTINTDECNNRILQLLQTKVGFLSDKYITDEELRTILKVFPLIVKNKGSKLGVEQAVRTFLKICGIKSKVRVHITNVANSTEDLKKSDKENKSYTVYIDLATTENVDTTILDEILKYIIPTGYIVKYQFIREFDSLVSDIESKIGVNLLIIKDSLNSLVRGAYIQYKDKTENNLIGTIGLTDVIANQCNPEYKGLLTSEEQFDTYAEKIRGYVYILKTIDEGGNTVFTVKIYDYDQNGELNWIDINSTYTEGGEIKKFTDRYNVFSKVVYGYYNNYKFYGKKQNPVYTQVSSSELPSDYILVEATPALSSAIYFSDNGDALTEVDKSGDSETEYFLVQGANGNEQSSITRIYKYEDGQQVMDNLGAFDTVSERYWKLDENNEWQYSLYNPSGIKIDTHGFGEVDGCEVLPDKDTVAFNCYYNGRNLQPVGDVGDTIPYPMMWESVYVDNEWQWSSCITDSDEILSALNTESIKHVYLKGTPMSADIDPKMYSSMSEIGEKNDMAITDNYMRIKWKPLAVEVGGKYIYSWSRSDYSDYINIKNSPNYYELLPSKDIVLSIIDESDITYYMCKNLIPTYSEEVSLSPDTLYIDLLTSEAYQQDCRGDLQQVLYYKKAENVYSINFDELLGLLDEGAIKPAWKNDMLIFEDSFGNMLLL